MALSRKLDARPDVAEVDTFFTTRNRSLLSTNARSALVLVYPPGAVSSDAAGPKTEKIVDELSSRSLKLDAGGPGPVGTEITDASREDLAKAELLTFPLLLILLLLVFRGGIAAMVPASISIVAVMGTFAGLNTLNDITPVSIFALNVATALGLGLSIDYGLLLVSRYRDELAKHGPGREALRATMTSAGRTVIYSGLTVAGTTSALLVFPERMLRSFGYGSALVALLSVGAAILVTPAVLALLGERINALSVRPRKGDRGDRDRWYRFSYFVMRHARPVALLSAAALIVLGLPFLRANFTGLDFGTLPKSFEARVVGDALSRDYQLNLGYVENVVVESRSGALTPRELTRFRAKARQLDGVAFVSPPRRLSRNAALVQVFPSRAAGVTEAIDVVDELRGLKDGPSLKVGGFAAQFKDFRSDIADRIPLAFSLMAILSMVAVFLLTGSVILPVKTLLMTVLTLSAAFGVLTLIFQDGRLENALDFQSPGGIDTAVSVFVFALVFGLATDYGMFILARTKELHDSGLADTEAVAGAMQTTGRVVTAAALLLGVAFGALATSSLITLKETGVATAFAIAVDATLVRALLVPSLMKLLGDWNWWAPRSLKRLRTSVLREQRA
jgi:RND superfamily putative drug exporter